MSRLVMIAAAAWLGAACSRPSARHAGAPSEMLRIGATLPLTGAEAKAGAAFKEGYELAVDEVNRSRGIDLDSGRLPVALALIDDRSLPKQAVLGAQRLVEVEKVQLLLGTYSIPLVKAQSAVADAARVPYVNGGAASAEIYQRSSGYVFGLLAPVDLLAHSEMRWVELKQSEGRLPNPLRIAVLWENTSHGKDFRGGLLEFAGKTARGQSSYRIVFDESFEVGSPDAKKIMGRLKAAEADVLLADAQAPDQIALHKEYLAQGLCHAVVSYGEHGNEGEAYLLSAVRWTAGAGPSKAFVEAFRARYGRVPDWRHALAYESARALMTAVRKAGSADRETVRAELVRLRMDSILPGGRLSFQNQQARYPFVVQQNQPDGSLPVVYPMDLAQTPGVAPNPRCGAALAQHIP
jgi:branched-chain amino acid transport system substrate-binding protein